MSDRNNADPGLFTILNQVVDGLATRIQIASIELSVAKNNAAKTAVYTVLAALFGLFALVFISVALLVSGKITAFSSPAASQALICSCSFSS